MNQDVRFGMMLTYPLPRPIQRIYRLSKKIEEFGFDSLWIADHTLFPGVEGFTADAWSILSVLSAKTEKVKLITGVTCPHRRHPAILAQTAATIDQLSDGRLIMGIGPGESMNLDPFGIEWKRPVSKLVEFVDVMRKLWRSDSSNTFDFDGEFYTLKGAYLDIKPVQEAIPVYIGANGPRTRRITGGTADGWVPITESPKSYKAHLKDVKRGATESNRDINEIDTCLEIYTSISEEREELESAKIYPMGALLTDLRKILDAGYKMDIPEELQELYSKKSYDIFSNLDEYIKYVPEEAVDDFSIMGNAGEAIEKIDTFIKSGVRHFCLMNVGPNPKETQRIYGEKIIPYFKGE